MSVWDRSLRRVLKVAEIDGRHNAHRFRDTFATSLLSKGVPLETVSVLLGHQRAASAANPANDQTLSWALR